MGDYVIRRDYDNSTRISALLNGGVRRFRVRFAARVYELTVDRP